VIRITKLSKRFDSDISAVCAAFHLTVAGGVIERAHRLWRHGGHPPARPPPRRRWPAALAEATIEAAIPCLAQDYQPLTDVRGTSQYRLTVAGNLLRRLWLAHAPRRGAQRAGGGRRWLKSTPHKHDSAALHVTGTARYIDDMPEPPGLLHLAFGLARATHAAITAMDLAAVRGARRGGRLYRRRCAGREQCRPHRA
jgi:hypothetical protein